jgi:CDGSH-type Zn-finger protein
MCKNTPLVITGGAPVADPRPSRFAMAPTKFTLPEEKQVALCNCKHTKTPPYCDGSHSKLPE